MRNARRLRLRFDEVSRSLKLTCPWRTSRKAALAWALDQHDWIEAQLARAEPAEPLESGAIIPLEGEEVRIVWDPAAQRTPLRDWHYLISGSRETVHEAGQSTRGWTVSENDAGELEYHVVERSL